jgi:hypothetical protein
MWICMKMAVLIRNEFFQDSQPNCPIIQCCGTETIYSGSSSDFGKVSVSVPFPDPDPKNTILSTFFQTKFFLQNLAVLKL